MKRTHSLFILLILGFISCAPEPPQTYKDQTFTDHFKQTSGIVAMDGGYSIPLTDGRSLFTYSDSYVDNYNFGTNTIPCFFQVRNAIQTYNISDPSVQTTLLGSGSPASFFQIGSDNSYWFWPQHGYQHNDTIYVFLQRLHSIATDPYFEQLDSSYVAKLHFPDLTVSGYSLLPNQNGISFGTSVFKEGGYCYVYGIKSSGFGNNLYVARFPESNIYSTWEYYNGINWTTNVNNANAIHNEFTYSFYCIKVNSKYLLITTEFSVGCNQGKTIYTQTASNPYGPFTNRKEVWKVDDVLNGNYPFFYFGLAHPEFNNGNNELLVTYCINGYGSCEPACTGQMDPNIYRPKAIRIPYGLMGVE
jgi:hypothetical protein